MGKVQSHPEMRWPAVRPGKAPGIVAASNNFCYSPLRNKLARTPGQGTSRRRKVITGVSGSQTGPSGGKFVRLAIPELVQAGGSISGTSGAVNWPLNLPGTGSQDAVDLTIPFPNKVGASSGDG
jgi:hypothetical protein